MDYLELTVALQPRDPWAEILISQLAEYGFESFVDTPEGIQAYGQQDKLELAEAKSDTLLANMTENVQVSFTEKLIPQQNWNAIWEADFHPVHVEDRLTIVAPFHDQSEVKGMRIEIQPQMSFGTGHHQTTWMMSKSLLDMDHVPATVLDMGTGTGVLAILAEKLGAREILAIDIEDWSVENTKENAQRNGCTTITALHGDVDLIAGKTFGLILANINKNILKSHLAQYALSLETGGTLMLSGFFETDADELIAAAAPLGLERKEVLSKETWACIHLLKK
jgi:ribosomal protein L11 methyltransferase